MRRAPAPLPQALRPLPDVGKGEVPPARPDPRRQRERLLAAAIRLFGERGYRHVTTDDLAADAGLSPSTLYTLVRDKQDCLLAAYDLVLDRARERIGSGIPVGASPDERIDAVITATLEEIAADPLGARLVILVAQTAGAEGAARHRRTLAAVAEALRRAWGPEGSEETPEGAANFAVAAAAFLLAASLDGPSEASTLHADLRTLLLPPAPRAEEASTPALSPHRSSPEEVDLRAQLPPGRHRLSREYVRKNQDDRLAAATIATIAARGFDETTVKDIVAAGRLSRRTFYQRFPNKTACFLATYELIASHLGEAAELRAAEVPDWPARPAATIEATLAVFAANPDLALFLLAAPLRADAPEPAAAYRRFLDRAAHRLCEGAPTDHAPAPPLAAALVAGLASLVVDAVESAGGEDLASLAPRLTGLFLAGLGQIATAEP